MKLKEVLDLTKIVADVWIRGIVAPVLYISDITEQRVMGALVGLDSVQIGKIVEADKKMEMTREARFNAFLSGIENR